MSITRALVLAGGGFAASAWEIGLITGLAEMGVDVRNADLFVGTSAGARVALHLTSGAALEEIYQRRASPTWRTGERPPSIDWVKIRADIARAKQAGGSPTEILQRLGALALASAVGKGSDRRPTVANQLPIEAWPEPRVLLAAVNAETGERHAFDRDSGIDLVDAVIATTASIGWPPTLFQGHHYIDGGFYSSDNADLAAGFDRVMVLALRTGAAFPAFPSISLVSLDTAVKALRHGGARVNVVHPDEDAIAALSSGGLMNPAISAPAAAAGRSQGRRIAESISSFWP
ncbi:MAG TPA: patatin-like phospholipase family protein [Bryobacteraceae bacterium]|nr:patatin-like phospholipase family protein [Bryobacteraceae bacterium]